MVRTDSRTPQLMVAVAAMTIGTLAGCGAKKTLPDKPREPLVLEYRMPEGLRLKYESSHYSIQKLEVRGMAATAESRKALAFSIESKGSKKGNHSLTVTIEKVDASLKTPEGDYVGDVRPVIGKNFDMTLSPLGDETDLSGAEFIEYGVGPGGPRNLSPDFEVLFPDLAGRPVNLGDTWTTRDTVAIKQGHLSLVINTESLNTLEGFEFVNRLACARITAQVQGAATGEGEREGAALSFEGQLSGAETWFFAYGEGFLVREDSDLLIEGSIAVGAPRNVTILTTQQTKSELRLIR